MAGIFGLRGTGDWGTDERPKNFRETILWNMPNGQAPLLALMGRLSEESVDDSEFSWWEEKLTLNKVQVNGSHAAGLTTITVDSGALQYVVGDILAVAGNAAAAGSGSYDKEHVRVVANPASDTSISVQRGAANTTAATIADNAWLIHIGSAHPEGGSAPRGSNRNPTKLSNLCQIFKTSYEVTKTAAKTNIRTGDPVANDKKRRMHDHSVAIEMAMLFGRKFETLGDNSKPQRYMGGLLSFLTTNYFTFEGVASDPDDWNHDNLMNKLNSVFEFNAKEGNERLVFAGNGAMMELNKLVKAQTATQINYDGVIKTYGMDLQRWVCPAGSFYFKTHPLFTQHPIFNKTLLILAPSNLKYRYLRGRDTMFEDNIQQKGDDALKGQWLTECSLEVHHEYTMAVLHNCGGAAL